MYMGPNSTPKSQSKQSQPTDGKQEPNVQGDVSSKSGVDVQVLRHDVCTL